MRWFVIDLLSLVRVHEFRDRDQEGRIVIVGKVDQNKFRVICERLVRLLGR